MARKPEVQYIRYYTDGSAARQPEWKPFKRSKTTLPEVKKQKTQVFYVQPLAAAGILLSAVLLVMMAVGCVQLHQARLELYAMEDYVAELTWDNGIRRNDYEASYDLETIRLKAEAMGMIPAEEAKHMTVQLPAVQVQEPDTVWDRLGDYFRGLFA